MTMDKGEGILALEVERFSKLGTSKLQQGQTEKALEAYKNAFKCSQGLGKHGYLQRACAFNLGAMLISIRKFSDGITYLNQAIPPEGYRDGRSNGDLYFNFGLAYDGLKRTADSKSSYETALKEYKSENNNLKMEAETIHRLGQLCVSANQFDEAEAWNKQLIQVYSILGDKDKSLYAQAERANIFLKVGRVEEAEDVADDCLKGAKTSTSIRLGNVYNELGLVFTQMTKYDKALECYKYALPLMESKGADAKLCTVLYQNLGALYNFMGRYEDAVEYHQMAANKHAELKNRKSQGHCFINMGYAYCHLQDLDKAGECFLHALQAARDCGDSKSEWQSLEALGSIAFQQNSLVRAQDYYKQSLATLSKCPDAKDVKIQERIVEKLSYILQVQMQKNNAKPPAHNVTQKTVDKELSDSVHEAKEFEKVSNPPDLSRGGTVPKDGSVIAVKRGSVVKYLKVRRSGTLRRFNKVALGLDLSPEVTAAAAGNIEEDAESLFSAVTISEGEVEVDDDDDDDDDDDEEEEEKKKEGRKLTVTLNSEGASGQGKKNYEELEEESSESDEDKDRREMKAALREYADAQPGDTQQFTQKVVADVHSDGKAKPEDDDESDSESDERDDDEDESDSPPPVPSKSPRCTATGPFRTYEAPAGAGGTLHYETIDHKPPSGSRFGDSRQSGGKAGENLDHSRGEGYNYFHDDDDGPEMIKEVVTSGSKTSGGNPALNETIGTVYESIRPPSRIGRNTPGAGNDADDEQETDNEKSKDSEGMGHMSKAEREMFLYHQFKSSQKKEDNAEETPGDQKNSKHCIVM